MIHKITQMLGTLRQEKPLIHHITNYVTVNDCANITLGIGASPIMADSLSEAADIAAMSKALVLNMGTLNERTVPSMLAAGQAANAAGVPVVFDPVGAGASAFRNDTAAKILETVKNNGAARKHFRDTLSCRIVLRHKGSGCRRQRSDHTG